MKNLKKKLLTVACVIGMIGLGYALPAIAFESKIPTDSPVVKTEEEWYPGVRSDHKRVTDKTLENGAEIRTYYNFEGTISYKTIYQLLSDGSTMIEIDNGCDGDIDYRVTFNSDGSVLYENQFPDGSVKKELIK